MLTNLSWLTLLASIELCLCYTDVHFISNIRFGYFSFSNLLLGAYSVQRFFSVYVAKRTLCLWSVDLRPLYGSGWHSSARFDCWVLCIRTLSLVWRLSRGNFGITSVSFLEDGDKLGIHQFCKNFKAFPSVSFVVEYFDKPPISSLYFLILSVCAGSLSVAERRDKLTLFRSGHLHIHFKDWDLSNVDSRL